VTMWFAKIKMIIRMNCDIMVTLVKGVNMKSLYQKALATEYHSRFVARADDLNRPLTDDEVREEARYQLETIDYSGNYDDDPKQLARVKRQLKALLK